MEKTLDVSSLVASTENDPVDDFPQPGGSRES
jgi:hypothetical protein